MSVQNTCLQILKPLNVTTNQTKLKEVNIDNWLTNDSQKLFLKWWGCKQWNHFEENLFIQGKKALILYITPTKWVTQNNIYRATT